MRKIIIVLLGLISFAYGQTGKFGYDTIRQYKGVDTIDQIIGADTARFNTSLDAFNFNKDLFVNGVAVGGGGGGVSCSPQIYYIDSSYTTDSYDSEITCYRSIDSLIYWVNNDILTTRGAISSTFVSGVAELTGISDSDNSLIKVGDIVTRFLTSSGIPYGTIVLSKGNEGGDANTIQLSNSPTTSGTSTLFWYRPIKVVITGSQQVNASIYAQGVYIENNGIMLFDNIILLNVGSEEQKVPYRFTNKGYIYASGSSARLYYELNTSSTNTLDHVCNLDFGNAYSEGLNEAIYISRYL